MSSGWEGKEGPDLCDGLLRRCDRGGILSIICQDRMRGLDDGQETAIYFVRSLADDYDADRRDLDGGNNGARQYELINSSF